jgi:hypothetical protein
MAHRPLRQRGRTFGESTRSKAIDGTCEFSTQMLRNLERAAEYEDMTEDFAEILSTRAVEVETGVTIR